MAPGEYSQILLKREISQSAHTAGVHENLRKPSRPPRPHLSPDTLTEVDDAGPNREPPAKIPKAMVRSVERKHTREGRLGGVAHETSGGVGVEADHKEEGKVVGVPERLEALRADLVVRSRVHQNHDEEHEVTGNAARLGVMDHLRALLADFYEDGLQPFDLG